MALVDVCKKHDKYVFFPMFGLCPECKKGTTLKKGEFLWKGKKYRRV